MAGQSSAPSAKPSAPLTWRLARFRYQLRKFLRFSERVARACGVTPQQHQLLLGVAGFTGRGWATVSDLAEFLQQRHNAVVGLVKRAELRGLVHKEPSSKDHRFVRVFPTSRGERTLRKLTQLHQAELRRFQAGLQSISGGASRATRESRGGARA